MKTNDVGFSHFFYPRKHHAFKKCTFFVPYFITVTLPIFSIEPFMFPCAFKYQMYT